MSDKKNSNDRKTISFLEFRQLSSSNSNNISHAVEIKGRRYEWTGIGWTNAGKPCGNEVLVIN